MTDGAQKTRLVLAVCTYQRNEPLAVLLRAMVVSATRLGDRAAVGVVVVDDSSDGQARVVVDQFVDQFALGVHYLRSGHQNISRARNLALDRAIELADWVAMTDDDCEPSPEWLSALLEVQQRTGADAIAGPYHRRVAPGSPPWLLEQPFLEIATFQREDGARISLAGTNNSLISSRWLRAHPEVRFQLNLGVTGGEDVVFFRSALAAGLRIHFARNAVVYENEPPSRATLAYQLWLFLWLGNGSYVTRRETAQATPLRMFLQGGNHVRKALQRPLSRVFRGQPPQLRYCLADVLYGLGELLGVLGVRIPHH